MPVYVDDAFIQATVPNGDRSVRSRWCHLRADTTAELDAMAERIGLRQRWRQATGTVREHYDVTESRRAVAVATGAMEITWRQGSLLTERKMRLRDGQSVVGATFAEELALRADSPSAAHVGLGEDTA